MGQGRFVDLKITQKRSNKIDDTRADNVGKSAVAVDRRTALFTRVTQHFGLPSVGPTPVELADF
jgi:hypothetical protein